MQREPHPFWRFSLRVYARAGVEQACLALQEAGADVNLLLLCCWQGSEGRDLTKDLLQGAMQAVVAWNQQVVQPLRQVRRIVKQGFPGFPSDLGGSLRKDILRVELDAEYLEQLVLTQYATAAATQPTHETKPEAIAAGNLTRYLELLGIPSTAAIRAYAETLSCASGPSPAAPSV